MSDPVLT